MIKFVFKSEAKGIQALLSLFYKWEAESSGRRLDLFGVISKINGKVRTEPKWTVPRFLVTQDIFHYTPDCY